MEKRYPTIEEETGMDMAAEPMTATTATDVQLADDALVGHDWIDDLDWSRFPSLGPFSDEEAIARIDKFEESLAKGEVKWISSEDAWKELYEKFPWLR